MDNRRLTRIALVALLALGCALILEPFVAAILFAAVICITSWPMYAWFLARLKGRAWLAAMLMTLLLTLVVVLPTALLAASLTEMTPALIAKIRTLIGEAQGAPPEWLQRIPLVGEQLDAYWQSLAQSRDEFNQLLRQLYDPTRRFLLRAGALAGATEAKMSERGRFRVRSQTDASTTKNAVSDSAKMIDTIPGPSLRSDLKFSSLPMLNATKPSAISVMKPVL